MTIHEKVLYLYHNDGYVKAWSYWKLMGLNYGIFLGEIPSSDKITGNELAKVLGITQGIPQYSDTPWLKFILDGNILYIPKKPIRHTVSWEAIYQAGAVYGTDDNGLHPSGDNRIQDARVSIDGYEFKATLMKGTNSDAVSSNTSSGHDNDWTHGSEWNRLMYPIHGGVHTSPNTPIVISNSYNLWASYSDEDLHLHFTLGEGTYSWTQEKHWYDLSHRVVRGGMGVTFSSRNTSTLDFVSIGWRPVLRMISS